MHNFQYQNNFCLHSTTSIIDPLYEGNMIFLYIFYNTLFKQNPRIFMYQIHES